MPCHVFSEKRGKMLFRSAEDGDITVIKQLVLSGVDPDRYRDLSKMTALHMAAGNGHLDCALFLLDKGAAIDARGADENTPLHLAAVGGHLSVVKLLCQRGGPDLLTLINKDKKIACEVASDPKVSAFLETFPKQGKKGKFFFCTKIHSGPG